MTTTPNLGIAYIDSGVPQPEVTHNDAIRSLDALVQLIVQDRDLATPPGSPSDGQRWIVAASPTGAWAGHAGHVLAWQDGAWRAYVPQVGWLAYVVDEGVLLAWSGSAWVDAMSMLTMLQNMVLFGLGTTADSTNPLSAKLNNTLWVAKTVAEGGDGNLRYKLSKESASKTLSLLMQTNFSGRAEFGLTGDDDFHVKVSPDGSAWAEALTIDRSTGGIRFLAAETSVASATTCDIGTAASLKVQITGTTSITSFGTVANAVRLLRFGGALTLTHNASSLILPGGANITTAAGDTCIAESDNSGTWRVRAYTKATGKALVESMNSVFGRTGTVAAAADDYTVAQIAGGTMSPGGRLTLASGTPIMTTSQSGKTTIYYALHLHDKVPIYDGANWHWTTFTELSNDTTASSTGKAGPAAVAANKNYDLYVWSDSGTLRLTRSPAWASDTSRGTGAGTAEQQIVNGITTNKVAITNGPGANNGTYVGTVRSDGSSQINWTYAGVSAGGIAGVFGLWNQFNRLDFVTQVGDSTSAWAYTTTSYRQRNNSTGNQISLVIGSSADVVAARNVGLGIVSSGSGVPLVGVGIDSTTANSAKIAAPNVAIASAAAAFVAAEYAGYPGIGWHTVADLELGMANGTMYGTGLGGQTGMTVEFRA